MRDSETLGLLKTVALACAALIVGWACLGLLFGVAYRAAQWVIGG